MKIIFNFLSLIVVLLYLGQAFGWFTQLKPSITEGYCLATFWFVLWFFQNRKIVKLLNEKDGKHERF